MNLKEFQRKALTTAIYPNIGKNWIYPLIGLGGEFGEIQNKLKKVIRDKDGLIDCETKHEITLELGDLMWYVVILCYELNIDPETVLDCNCVKLSSRKQKGTISGSGDHRQ